jgi:hypothetical protein
MSLLIRPLLVLLTVVLIFVLILVALFGGFSGGGGDSADKPAEKAEKADKPAKAPAGTVSAQDLKVGDCITDARSTTGDVKTFVAVACSKRHDGEVYTLIKLKAGKYPGRKFVTGKGDRGCRARLKRQATTKALSDRNLAPYRYVYPTEASWAQDYRNITCLATFHKARKGKLKQR